MSNAVTTQSTAPSMLSTDIHVITAEINAYQRVAGEAIFEIGKRLKRTTITVFTSTHTVR